MGGTATTERETVELLGTAAAVRVPGGSHLFLVPSPSDSLRHVYISIVVAEPGWPTGIYGQGIAGALEVTTADDCSYQTQLPAGPGAFRLEVTGSGAGFNGEFYLSGKLEATLPSQNGRAPLRLEMTIN